jgi:glycosyltransferase involved in cell wall biosynthesis
MAEQRIVVASDIGGHRELMRHRETAYLFAPDNPRHVAEGILGALYDRPAWPRIQSQALRFVEQERCWEANVARYDRVYNRLLNPAGDRLDALAFSR